MIKQYFNLNFEASRMVELFDADPRKDVEKDGDITRNYREGVSLRISGLPEWKPFNKQIFDVVGWVADQYVRENGSFVMGPVEDTGYTVHKYNPGEVAQEHRDGGPYQLDIFLAVVLFMNSLTDGRLVFPEQKVSFRPVKYSALVFPAHFAFPHYSEKASTERYVCVTWLRYNQWRTTTGEASADT